MFDLPKCILCTSLGMISKLTSWKFRSTYGALVFIGAIKSFVRVAIGTMFVNLICRETLAADWTGNIVRKSACSAGLVTLGLLVRDEVILEFKNF